MHLIPKLYILFLRRLDTHVNTVHMWKIQIHGQIQEGETVSHSLSCILHLSSLSNWQYLTHVDPIFEARVVMDGNRHFDVGIEGLYAFGLDIRWFPPFRDAKAKWRLKGVTVIDRRDHPKSWGVQQNTHNTPSKKSTLAAPTRTDWKMINTIGISISSELHCRSEPLTILEKKQQFRQTRLLPVATSKLEIVSRKMMMQNSKTCLSCESSPWSRNGVRIPPKFGHTHTHTHSLESDS